MTASSIPATADICDEKEDDVYSCDTQFLQFGAREAFSGQVVTLRCNEDNALVKSILAESGEGKVLVVDGGGSLRRALMGDMFAAAAVASHWSGVIINGAVRDVDALAQLDLGIKALGTNPRRGHKTGAGERDVVVEFGHATFTPGARLVSDRDGIVVFPR